MLRISLLLLVLAISAASLYAGAPTTAKYVAEASGTATGRAAKWDIELKVGSGSYTDIANFTVDLFTTVYEGSDLSTVEDGTAHLSADKIAPGTGGKFTISAKSLSEVACTIAITATANNAGVPIKWSTTGNGTDWNTTFPTLPTATATTINAGDNGANPVSVTIYWQWAFGSAGGAVSGLNNQTFASTPVQTDATDTALGTAATAAPTVTITVTATQVD
ncbi:MAG: hypothetical protein LBQ80_04395 [Clostridium sp.]|nr:hypothetical protein [Clostridium sp.]